MNKQRLLASVALASILVGCGGGSSSDSSTSSNVATQSVSGKAVDPEIEGATASIICGSNTYTASQTTNTSGDFTINSIPMSQNLNDCTLSVSGGSDSGESLDGLVLKAPFSMFTNGQVYVTPLTTMVANHKDSRTNLSNAMNEVRSFMGLSSGDLLKNPVNDINIAKKTKKLTKIALSTRNGNGQKLGFDYIDIDSDSNLSAKDSFNNFLTTDVANDANNSATLMNTLNQIDTYSSIDDIYTASIQPAVYQKLVQTYDANLSLNNIQSNLTHLSKEIMKAAKRDSRYYMPSRFQIMKALSDVNLTASFVDGTLKAELITKLTDTNTTFASAYTSADMNISTLTGITFFNTNSYKKIVGNDNAARIQYYTFSDASHMSKAYELTKNIHDDDVLDPTYTNIAKGYANLGYYNEALDILNKNIYIATNKIAANNAVASVFVSHGQKASAVALFDKNFAIFKNYVKAVGAANLSNSDASRMLTIFLNYYNLGETAKAEEVLKYHQDNIVPSLNNTTTYGRLAVAYRDLINIELDKGNKDQARYLFNKAYAYVKSQPVTASTVSSAVSNLLFIAKPGAVLKEKAKVDELIALGEKYDADHGTNYMPYTSANYTGSDMFYARKAATVSGLRALNGEKDTIYAALKKDGITSYSFKNDVSEDATSNGIAAAFAMDGNITEAVKLSYEYRPFKSYEGAPLNLGNQLLRRYVPLSISGDLDTTRVLKAHDKDVMIAYLKALTEHSKTWTITDKSAASYMVNDNYGFLVMAQHYNDVNATTERDDIIKHAITVAKAMTEEKFKIQSYVSIIKAVDKLKVTRSAEVQQLEQDLETLASGVSLNNTETLYTTNIGNVIEVAKYLSSINKLDASKTLLDKAFESLATPSLGDKTRTEDRLHRLIGKIDWAQSEADRFSGSLLSGYIQAKQYAKAKELVDTVANEVAGMGRSLDAYLNYVAVARAYAAINNYEKTREIINRIGTLKERNKAIVKSANYFANHDAFSKTTVASVDTDADGKPDFWNIKATSAQITASGLTLDDDIDNDGVLDINDELPYSKNN